MRTVTVPQLQTNEELEGALSGVAFNLEWRAKSISVDIGGILLSIESNPQPGDIVEVTLAIENATGLFYDAGTLWRIGEPAQQHYVFFRPTQSEAVFLQFGDIAVHEGGSIVEGWPTFAVSA